MSEERAMYRVNPARSMLAGEFEAVMQRLERGPAGESARVLASFASALLNSEAYNLEQIEALPDPGDRDLCLALFGYCMGSGLSEDERRDAAAAFVPFLELHAPGTRH